MSGGPQQASTGHHKWSGHREVKARTNTSVFAKDLMQGSSSQVHFQGRGNCSKHLKTASSPSGTDMLDFSNFHGFFESILCRVLCISVFMAQHSMRWWLVGIVAACFFGAHLSTADGLDDWIEFLGEKHTLSLCHRSAERPIRLPVLGQVLRSRSNEHLS